MISATAAAGTTPPAHSPSVWIDRLSKAPHGQDMRKVQWRAHVPHTHTHTHTPFLPNCYFTHTHTQLSAPLLLLLPRGSRKLFGYFFLESYYSWSISKETAPGCALLLWHWLGLFSLLGCYCDQMTVSAHHCFPTKGKGDEERGIKVVFSPFFHPISFSVYFWIRSLCFFCLECSMHVIQ